MKFITETYSFASDDGRVVLRACIDRPLYFDHIAFEYFNSYSNAIIEFAREKLFLRAKNLYNSAIINNLRFMPLLYTFKCSETYYNDIYSSYLMSGKLSQSTNIMCKAIDSVVFINAQILPPVFISRKHKKEKLVLDSEGFPCTVYWLNDTTVIKRVGKYSVIKQ